jgi:hypothetical protein
MDKHVQTASGTVPCRHPTVQPPMQQQTTGLQNWGSTISFQCMYQSRQQSRTQKAGAEAGRKGRAGRSARRSRSVSPGGAAPLQDTTAAGVLLAA